MFALNAPTPFSKTLENFYTNCSNKSTEPRKTAEGWLVPSNADILKVSKEFKSHLTSLPQSLGITIISTEDHPQISQLKIKYLDKTPQPNEKGYLIRFILKNSGEKLYFYVRDDSRYPGHYCNQINTLKTLAPIQNTETILSKKQRQSGEVRPLETWGEDWEENKRSADIYRRTLDPMVLENLDTYVFPEINENRELIIMDIGGGKGRLAEKIIHSAQKKNIKVYYILLEPIASQVNKAKERLSQLKAQYGDKLIIQTIISTLYNFTRQECYHTYAGAVDCIISSGGPLNKSIVSEADAQKNLAIMHALLRKDGKILVNGLTPPLITKKDFYKCGFMLFNMAKKLIDVDDDLVVKQNYVAKKK